MMAYAQAAMQMNNVANPVALIHTNKIFSDHTAGVAVKLGVGKQCGIAIRANEGIVNNAVMSFSCPSFIFMHTGTFSPYSDNSEYGYVSLREDCKIEYGYVVGATRTTQNEIETGFACDTNNFYSLSIHVVRSKVTIRMNLKKVATVNMTMANGSALPATGKVGIMQNEDNTGSGCQFHTFVADSLGRLAAEYIPTFSCDCCCLSQSQISRHLSVHKIQ